jgi:hypothetical protein
MSVVDVSSSGALVEGSVRLLPGTRVDVHVITRAGRVLVRSRVVRCWVAAVDAAAVSYRGGIAFDETVDTSAAGYVFPGTANGSGAAQGRDYPAAPLGVSSPDAERLSA